MPQHRQSTDHERTQCVCACRKPITLQIGDDAAGQAEPSELVVENLVALKAGGGVVGDLHSGRLAIVDTVLT